MKNVIVLFSSFERSWHLHSSENSQEFFAMISFDLLRLFATIQQLIMKNVRLFLVERQTLKALMNWQMLNHPVVEIFDIGDRVKQTLEECYAISFNFNSFIEIVLHFYQEHKRIHLAEMDWWFAICASTSWNVDRDKGRTFCWVDLCKSSWVDISSSWFGGMRHSRIDPDESFARLRFGPSRNQKLWPESPCQSRFCLERFRLSLSGILHSRSRL